MINAISPAEVQTFKGAIDSLFDCERPQLAAVDPEPEPEPEPSEDAVIEVVAETNGHNGNGHGDIIEMEDLEIGVSDIEAALGKLGINELRKLAKAKRLDSKGAKFILIKRLIGAGITEAEVMEHTSK